MSSLLNGPCYRSGSAVESLVVMLHGRGASGDNIIAAAPGMAKLGLVNVQFVAPHAPLRYCPTSFTWFTESLREMQEETAFKEIMRSVEMVNQFIDAQLDALGLGNDKLALVGFSQGAMLSMYVGLSRAEKCAAVVAYSGAVPFPHLLESQINSKPSVCVVHGECDSVIPFSYFGECVDFLRKNQVPVTASGLKLLGHSINETGLKIGSEFIKDRITK
ncbi:alpha/beta hydrolase [Candidatus Anaplasma sp. TIGMIC]|uniref:alpha/beta hydrolase n=1 Tax=Candidatus Anaplasma sp. TIGMIC TaxID=3020713 RepID=UPI0023304780|nr:alpha/beta fold hydrolase [Candidatus Anaplasma sp. TIGMIC]MDB1135367.1 alpha/beta fold hydrolase [Candidatus Anaplasma sp. TIGMIC]